MVLTKRDRIESIQLEPTSRCNLYCTTCLKPAYGDAWHGHDMDATLFTRILDQIKGYRPPVHLQGWGESLLHKRLFQFIVELKECDIPVTFSSNGTMLTEALADDLVKSGLDGITFSMSGTSSETQDPLRGDGSFERLERSVKTMVAARKVHGSTAPKIALSYLLTPQTVRELPGAVTWCARLGVDALVCVAMTQVATRAQESLRFYIKKEERRFRLLRVRSNIQALLHGVSLDMKPFHPVLTGVCSKNPLHSFFISSRGEVSPCVFQCPPIGGSGGAIDWQYNGKRKRISPLVFGNLTELSLREIWEGEEYCRFREAWRKRLSFHDKKLGRVAYSLEGAVELEKAVADINDFYDRNPVPDACALCGKKDGF